MRSRLRLICLFFVCLSSASLTEAADTQTETLTDAAILKLPDLQSAAKHSVTSEEIKKPSVLIDKLKEGKSAMSQHLWEQLEPQLKQELTRPRTKEQKQKETLAQGLNDILTNNENHITYNDLEHTFPAHFTKQSSVHFAATVVPTTTEPAGVAYELHNDTRDKTILGVVLNISGKTNTGPLALQLFIRLSCPPLQSVKGHSYFFNAFALDPKNTVITLTEAHYTEAQ